MAELNREEVGLVWHWQTTEKIVVCFKVVTNNRRKSVDEIRSEFNESSSVPQMLPKSTVKRCLNKYGYTRRALKKKSVISKSKVNRIL